MTDWSGRDYAEVSGLQRTMVNEANAGLEFSRTNGCSMSPAVTAFSSAVAGMVPGGYAVGADASPRMIATAHAAAPTDSGPWFVVADARRRPFGPHFDAVVSFNALHWVREQQQDRDRFVRDEVRAYEPVAGGQGLFRFTQMRAKLRR